MRVYADSSALVKRSLAEAESSTLRSALDRFVGDGALLVSSALAWIEVSRALRVGLTSAGYSEERVSDAVDAALSGVAERPITVDVVGLARRVPPTVLCSLDAVHLATAILLDVDVVVAYDERLLSACRASGLAAESPGRHP